MTIILRTVMPNILKLPMKAVIPNFDVHHA